MRSMRITQRETRDEGEAAGGSRVHLRAPGPRKSAGAGMDKRPVSTKTGEGWREGSGAFSRAHESRNTAHRANIGCATSEGLRFMTQQQQ